MTLDRDEGYLHGLANELRKLPAETTWVEFKENNENPDEIGEYDPEQAKKNSRYLPWWA